MKMKQKKALLKQLDLAKILLDKKLAVPYNGGTKIDWCK